MASEWHPDPVSNIEHLDGWCVYVRRGCVSAVPGSEPIDTRGSPRKYAVVWPDSNRFEFDGERPLVDSKRTPVAVITRMLELWRELKEEKR